MLASSRYQRALLRRLFITAEASGITLLDQFNAELGTLVDATKGGQFVTNTSSNGFSVGMRGGGGMDPSHMAETVGRFIELHEQVAEDGDTQQEILTAMLAKVQPIRRFRSDFSVC